MITADEVIRSMQHCLAIQIDMKGCKPAGASQDAYIRLYDRKEGVAEGTALLLPRLRALSQGRRDCMQVSCLQSAQSQGASLRRQ